MSGLKARVENVRLVQFSSRIADTTQNTPSKNALRSSHPEPVASASPVSMARLAV